MQSPFSVKGSTPHDSWSNILITNQPDSQGFHERAYPRADQRFHLVFELVERGVGVNLGDKVSVSATGPNAPMMLPATKCQIAFFPLVSAANLKWIADQVLAATKPATQITSTAIFIP